MEISGSVRMVTVTLLWLLTVTRWLTEKFDGMRLFWTGKQLFTRQGKEIIAPQFFTNQLPSVPLDGELW
jgi:ATP-dependent DNA ligase